MLNSYYQPRGIKARAQCLIWQEYSPPWLKQLPTQNWWSSPEIASNMNYMELFLSAAMKKFIQSSNGDPNYYHSISIVNEPISPQLVYNSASYKGGPYQPAGVPCTQAWPANYLAQAYLFADYYNNFWASALKLPKTNAKFFLNETGADTDQFGPVMRQGILATVKAMKAYPNLKLDAVGLECHLQPQMMNDPYNPNWTAFGSFIQALGDLGVEVYITELDVLDWENSCWGQKPGPLDSDYLTNLYYDTFMNTILKYRAVKSVCLWDLSDRYSFYRAIEEEKWYNYNTGVKTWDNWPRCYSMPPSNPNGTGTPLLACPRPNVYDDKMVAKPGRQSIANALASAPVR